jgi:hypothetical protein
MSRIRLALSWGIKLGILLGIVLCLLAFWSRLHFSHRAAYDRIYLGMTRDEVIRSLQSSSIECGLTEPDPQAATCHFSDAWRLYSVAVDMKAKRVARKTSGLREPESLVSIFIRSRSRWRSAN